MSCAPRRAPCRVVRAVRSLTASAVLLTRPARPQDKLLQFWELTKAELAEARATARLQARAAEEEADQAADKLRVCTAQPAQPRAHTRASHASGAGCDCADEAHGARARSHGGRPPVGPRNCTQGCAGRVQARRGAAHVRSPSRVLRLCAARAQRASERGASKSCEVMHTYLAPMSAQRLGR